MGDGGDFKTEITNHFLQIITGYQLLSNFIDAMDGDYLLPAWRDCIVETVRDLREERASEVFLNVLGQFIGNGQCRNAPSLRAQGETSPGHTVVGYRDENFLYMLLYAAGCRSARGQQGAAAQLQRPRYR